MFYQPEASGYIFTHKIFEEGNIMKETDTIYVTLATLYSISTPWLTW